MSWAIASLATLPVSPTAYRALFTLCSDVPWRAESEKWLGFDRAKPGLHANSSPASETWSGSRLCAS